MSATSRHHVVFVGTRADLGPLGPVITALAALPDASLTLITGVAFDVDALRQALPDDVRDVDVLAVTTPISGPLTPEEQVLHGCRLASGLATSLAGRSVDAGVVLGDRWELLHVVPALFVLGIPIVHLHGGEVTEGAMDDRIRHAVTKLADVHCVASPDAAARVRQLGEPDDRIVVTGAPGLDRYVEVAALPVERLTEIVGTEVLRPLVLFTYHPVTVGEADTHQVAEHSRQALEAALSFGGTVIATHPGMDRGREELLAVLDGFGGHPRLVVTEALGHHYPAVLASADVVVGNSSSGIIEAGAVGIPAVDIGIRQLGRERGPNVVHADDGEGNVHTAIAEALAAAGRQDWPAANPYGDGRAAPRILDVVLGSDQRPRQKEFVDRRLA